MPAERPLWGIHMPSNLRARPLEEGFIALGAARLGDITRIPPNRDAFKQRFAAAYPDARPGAVPVKAGVYYRFANEIQVGDRVVYPSKPDRMINLGIVRGPCVHHADETDEVLTHRRAVDWVGHVPRASFSQAALHEIGSALTLFQVTNHADEFAAALQGKPAEVPPADDEETIEAVSEQMQESTDDFVLRRLKTSLSPYEFEHFVAHLLTAMGYRARVTKRAGDGGVDIVAHKDELGFEPPIIKVQCKQTTSGIGRPDVQRLDGATQATEFGLFVTLGGYSPDARTYEQMKPNLRLIDGEELAQMIYRYYERFSPAYQKMLPLTRAYRPGTAGSD